MCGFVGVLSDQAEWRSREIVDAMLARIAHRGPDGYGLTESGNVTLGFRRLSVIDLSEAALQPMVSSDGGLVMVFNGEIYNYRELRTILETDHGCVFRTKSDTEVLLEAYRAWGTECFSRLNGMFAVAILHSDSGRLVLARDRGGKKPLFTWRQAGTMVFASEVKALLAHPVCVARADVGRVMTSLFYRYVPGQETLFDNVEAFPAGCWRSYNQDGLPEGEPVRFWTPKFADAAVSTSQDANALTDELENLLRASVQRRLVADVPVGAFLSGGVDSSLIVALMAGLTREPISTFSIGFDTGFSEHTHARYVAGHFDTVHHETIIKAEHLLDCIPAVLWHRETPISEPSDIPLFLLAKAARHHVTVALSGEGSDELFGGYPKYVAEYALRGGFGRVARAVARPLARLAGWPGGSSRVGLALAALAEGDAARRGARWFGAFGERDLAVLLTDDARALTMESHAFAQQVMAECAGATSLTAMQHQDYAHWLPANLLLRGDRVTMAHSLELRCPFMDPEIVDFAFARVPDHLKIRGGVPKWIVRRLAERYLPPAIAERKKWGFKVPVDIWFRGPLKESLKDVLLSQAATGRGYFRRSAVERLIARHVDDGWDLSKQLWYLYQLELWHLMYIDGTLDAGQTLR